MSEMSELKDAKIELLENAKKVVVDLLKLDSKDETNETSFLARHRDEIYNKLDHIYQTEAEHELVFIAESLPLINGIVHVGSTFDDLKKATNWVKDEFQEDANPFSVLSALTFLYIVSTGGNRISKDKNASKEKKERWERICQIVGAALKSSNSKEKKS